MIGQSEALRLYGCEVFDPAGHRAGIVGQLFLDARTEQPTWIAVQTGLFGTNESFVPLDGAAFDGDTLTVAVSKSAVRRAPRMDLSAGDLTLAQERVLYLYYGRSHGLVPRQRETEPVLDAHIDSDSAREYVVQVQVRLRRLSAVT